MANNEELGDQQNGADETNSGLDDPEPGERLGELDSALESHEYPTTDAELVEAYGDYEVQTQDGWESLDEVLVPADDQLYGSAEAVRRRVLGLINRR